VPPKFIRPCIPRTATTIPRGDGWLHEPKLDGYRLQIVKDGDSMLGPERRCAPSVRYRVSCSEGSRPTDHRRARRRARSLMHRSNRRSGGSVGRGADSTGIRHSL